MRIAFTITALSAIGIALASFGTGALVLALSSI